MTTEEPRVRDTVIRLLWQKQFEKSPWRDKFHLIRPDSLGADYGALADEIIAAVKSDIEACFELKDRRSPALSPPEPTEGLHKAMLAFEDFLNEPPTYEEMLRVREYRHEAYREWLKLRGQITAVLSLQDHGWRDISSAPKDSEVAYFYLDWADDCARLNEPLDPNASLRFFRGKWRCWGSVYKATHWQPCFAPTAAPAMVAEDHAEGKS